MPLHSFLILCLIVLSLLSCSLLLLYILFGYNFKKLEQDPSYTKFLTCSLLAFLFLLVCYYNLGAMILGLWFVLGFAWYEIRIATLPLTSKQCPFSSLIIISYHLLLPFAAAHLFLLIAFEPNPLIAERNFLFLIIGTSFAEAFSFFYDKFSGHYKLPKVINENKSWDGVIGQIIGAFVGVILVNYFLIKEESILIALPIGLGSACGSLLNDAVKTRLKLTKWRNSISAIDLFCGLTGSGILTHYFVYWDNPETKWYIFRMLFGWLS